MKSTIRIMVVEDNPQYRDVLELALLKEPDLELISAFGTAEDALRSTQDMSTRKEPDTILLDLNLPGMTGLEAIPFFQSAIPSAQIIVLTQSKQEEDVIKAMSLGAAGYLLKASTVFQIREGIRSVNKGGIPIDANVAMHILKTLKTKPPKPIEEPMLSDREMEILTLIAKGFKKKEIADQLNISIHTVITHTSHVYEKLNVDNAPSAVDTAHTLGLFPK